MAAVVTVMPPVAVENVVVKPALVMPPVRVKTPRGKRSKHPNRA